MIRVAIVDDHKIFREGIGVILSNENNIDVQWSSNDYNSTLGRLRQQPVDVILFDIGLGKDNGLDLAGQIISEFEKVKIIALTMHYEDDYIIQMLKIGAKGYLLKDCSSDELIKAIELVNQGGTFYSEHVNSVLIDHIKKGKSLEENLKSPITKREMQVLKLVAEEYSNSEIADQLFISIRTVDTHKRNLIEKLNVKNAIGLARYAIKNNIVTID